MGEAQINLTIKFEIRIENAKIKLPNSKNWNARKFIFQSIYIIGPFHGSSVIFETRADIGKRLRNEGEIRRIHEGIHQIGTYGRNRWFSSWH